MATEVSNPFVEVSKKKKPRPKYSGDNVPLETKQNGNSLDKMLQDAVKSSTNKKKKSKKKDAEVLNSLRNSGELQKETDDATLLKNTFDPDDAKEKNNNTRRQSGRQIQDGEDNKAFLPDNLVATKSKKKTKPSVVSMEEGEGQPTTGPAAMQVVETEMLEKPARKKKKKIVSADEDINSAGRVDTADAQTDGEVQTPARNKVKKKRRRKPPETDEPTEETSLTAENEPATEEAEPSVPTKEVPDDGRILHLTVHRTDKLKTDFLISHPLVRIHIIDSETGEHLKKYQSDRRVTSYYEADGEHSRVDYILPIMTQPFDFKKMRSTLPVWEEVVIFNESYNYVVDEDTNALFMFEVLDFCNMATVSKNLMNNANRDGGWYRIAWAFLKVRGGNGHINIGRKMRLQLYQTPLRFRPKNGPLEIYQWWKSAPRVPYNSTLYVTIKSIVPPAEISPAMRSMFATQQERGHASFDELQRTSDATAKLQAERSRQPESSLWSRFPGQVCKIPNQLVLSLPAASKGCTVLRFSHSGLSLACGGHDKDGYPIAVYEIPGGSLKGRLPGHHGIIYDMCWSRDDKHLITASSDATARVWDMTSLSSAKTLCTLPHPCFVYCAQFHVRVLKVAVTAGYDCVIRVWSLLVESGSAQLMQELDGHSSYINTLVFDDEGSKLYSGDSVGELRIWNVYTTDQPSKRGARADKKAAGILKDWSVYKILTKEVESEDRSINAVRLHPSGRRILIHSKEKGLRMLDLKVYAIMQRYIGSLNFREHIRSCITPCGSFVIAGSEDSAAYVWNAETGDQVAMYNDLGYKNAVSDVHFHPFDHMVAFCGLGDNHHVLVYKFDHKVAQKEAGLSPRVIEPLSVRTVRPGSPEVRQDGVTSDDGLENSRSNIEATRGEFRASDAARMDRVRRKLQSVTALASVDPHAADALPLAAPPQAITMTTGHSTLMSSATWGSTFDTTLLSPFQSRSKAFTSQMDKPGESPVPGAFSPHASPSPAATLQRQHFDAQAAYLRDTEGRWRPGFSPIGRASPHSRGPQMSLNTTQGKMQFNIQSPSGKAQQHEKVVCMYDYAAARSDELSIVRGDVLTVLHKDNENWWCGELPDGRQGFFPVNYVTQEGDEDPPPYDAHARPADTEPTKRVAAVVTKSGDLQFVSGGEEDQEDPELSSRKKNKGVGKKSRRGSMAQKKKASAAD